MNANVFAGKPIDETAIEYMLALGCTRALELFKEIEEKAENMHNPSGYLITAAKKELPMGMPAVMPTQATEAAWPPAAMQMQPSGGAGGAFLSDQQRTTIFRRVSHSQLSM